MKRKTKPIKLEALLPRTIPFHNDKGDIIHIPAHYKIEDLIRMGVKKIKFTKPESFIPSGWYVEGKRISPEQTKTTNNKTKTKG